MSEKSPRAPRTKPTFDEIMDFLKNHANPTAVNTYKNHGAREPIYGVRISDLKIIMKKIKKDHELSLKLYDTGNSDAMYLAGLIADETRLSRDDLQNWVEKAYWYLLFEHTVPTVTAETPHARELALQWMQSDAESIEAAGWATYSCMLAVKDNSELDCAEIEKLLNKASKELHEHKNRVRYTMNSFVISVGTYIPELYDRAIEVAKHIGTVSVDMGNTACKVPFAPDYIAKIEARGNVGKKRKTARC